MSGVYFSTVNPNVSFGSKTLRDNYDRNIRIAKAQRVQDTLCAAFNELAAATISQKMPVATFRGRAIA